MPAASVNGTLLHYEVEGAGHPLVVLHGGLGVDHLLYRRTLGPLSERFQLVLFDQRGNGRSDQIDLATLTMEQLADDAAGLADALGLERFTVLGHSYGGFVAQELALRHRDRLDGVILVTTTPGQLGRDESADESQGPPPPPEVDALMSALPANDEEFAQSMVQLLPHYFPGFDIGRVLPLLDGTIYRASAMVRGFEVLATWSSVDRLDQIAAPTLVLAGRNDYFTSAPQSLRIGRRIRNAEVEVFEGSGHFPWIQEPEPFFSRVSEWAERKLGA